MTRTESSFVGVRIRVPLAPAFLVASDAGLRPCPLPPLPTPWPSSPGSGSALIGQVEVIGRSVVTPRHGRGHGPCYRAWCARGRCELLAETVYHICFGQKMSYLHIGIVVLIWIELNLLDIHQCIFDCLNICMLEKGFRWPFNHNMVNLPFLWMYSP